MKGATPEPSRWGQLSPRAFHAGLARTRPSRSTSWAASVAAAVVAIAALGPACSADDACDAFFDTYVAIQSCGLEPLAGSDLSRLRPRFDAVCKAKRALPGLRTSQRAVAAPCDSLRPMTRTDVRRLVAIWTSVACVPLACDPPPTPASLPPLASTPATLSPTPSPSPPPAPKSLAAVLGPDAAAALMDHYGVNEVASRCHDANALDGGTASDASLDPDGGSVASPRPTPWKNPNPRPWQTALHGYETRVRQGNQHALNEARLPFAKWLNAVHNRIHPIWADGFLTWLDTLPCDDPKNSPQLFTQLELAIKGDTGRIVRIGVVRPSGIEEFDLAAITAFERAAPFPIAAAAIRSSDGNVYIRWEMHRDEAFACSTVNARPFLLDLSATP